MSRAGRFAALARRAVRSLRAHVPEAVVARLPAPRQRFHFREAVRHHRFARAAALARPGLFPEGALFSAVDILLAQEQDALLPQLAPMAEGLAEFEAAIWQALARHGQGDMAGAVDALAGHGADRRFGPFQRMAARAWGVFLMMRRVRNGGATAPGPPIMQYWDSPKPPDDVDRAMSAWRRLAGDRYHRLDRNAARAFLRTEFGPAESAVFDLCRHPAIESDYVRLAWLARHGGVYLDADSAPRPGAAALLSALGGKTGLWFYSQKAEGHFPNGFVAAPPEAPLILALLAETSRRIAKDPDGDVYQLAGPGAFTDVVLDFVANHGTDSLVALPNAQVRGELLDEIPADYKSDARSWHIWQAARSSARQ